jgi:hypothetical protein
VSNSTCAIGVGVGVVASTLRRVALANAPVPRVASLPVAKVTVSGHPEATPGTGPMESVPVTPPVAGSAKAWLAPFAAMQAVEDAAGSSGDPGTGAGGLTVLPPLEQAATAAATQTAATM